MDCIIPQFNVKVFEKLCILLMKLGTEIQIQVNNNNVNLITVNNSKSVFISAELSPEFFNTFNFSEILENNIRIPSKILMIFVKSLKTLERNIENVHFSVNPYDLSFGIKSTSGSSKLFEFSIVDGEPISPAIDLAGFLITFNVSCHVLLQAVGSFNNHANEITCICSSSHIVLRNNLSPEKCIDFLQTEIVLNTEDFDEYHWSGEDTMVTFDLKDFKHVLWFGDVFNQSINVLIMGPGRPIRLSLRSEGILEIVCLLSTVYEKYNPDLTGAKRVCRESLEFPLFNEDRVNLFMNWSQDTVFFMNEGNVLVSDSECSADDL